MSKRNKFPELKQEIKAREAASREIRKLISGSVGLARHEHWCDKRHHGVQTRHLLLLYAYLRQVPYLRLETKSRTSSYFLAMAVWWAAKDRGIELDKVMVKGWVDGFEAPSPALSAAEQING